MALQGYLQQLAAPEPETLAAAEPETPPAPEPAAEPMLTPKARSPQPAGLELLLWLALLLIDGLLALGDLLAPHRSGMPASRAAGSTAAPSGPGVVRWMGGALNPAPLA